MTIEYSNWDLAVTAFRDKLASCKETIEAFKRAGENKIEYKYNDLDELEMIHKDLPFVQDNYKNALIVVINRLIERLDRIETSIREEIGRIALKEAREMRLKGES